MIRFFQIVATAGLMLVSTLSIGELVACQVLSDGEFSLVSAEASSTISDVEEWDQWRGPYRDGTLKQASWPDSLDEGQLKKQWSVKLGPSYSGPIVVGDQVFTTETRDKKFEVVTAYNRTTGEKLWTSEWEGAMSVPFFARANGSWIRSTPIYDEGKLYVAGIRDLLVCLDAKTGEQIWKLDFPAEFGSSVPSFGFVCSPLIDGDALYVQAGGAFCKLNKENGSVIWKALGDGGGMNGSAFSSPIIATVAGTRQAIVQTRPSLCGVDLETGKMLWSQDIPTFRGMNIITPIVFKDSFFNTTYGGTTQLISLDSNGGKMQTTQKWKLPAEGYMSSPVVVNGHAYVHLKNQRFACYDLENGVEKWRTKPYGKYASFIAAGDKILALTSKGELLMIKANPEEFEQLDSRTVGDDSWAHLAVRGDQVFVRNLNELTAYKWQP